MKYMFYDPGLPLQATKNGYGLDEDKAAIKYTKTKGKKKDFIVSIELLDFVSFIFTVLTLTFYVKQFIASLY